MTYLLLVVLISGLSHSYETLDEEEKTSTSEDTLQEQLVTIQQQEHPIQYIRYGDIGGLVAGLGGSRAAPDLGQYCACWSTCEQCVHSYWTTCTWTHYGGCGLSAVGGAGECPALTHEGPLAVAARVRRYLRVRVRAPDAAMSDLQVTCRLALGDHVILLHGRLWAGHVHCYPVRLDLDTRTQVWGSFSVLWGGRAPSSNELPVRVYVCEDLAPTCASCAALSPALGCVWCATPAPSPSSPRAAPRPACTPADLCTHYAYTCDYDYDVMAPTTIQ